MRFQRVLQEFGEIAKKVDLPRYVIFHGDGFVHLHINHKSSNFEFIHEIEFIEFYEVCASFFDNGLF